MSDTAPKKFTPMDMDTYLSYAAFGSSALKDALDCPARCKGSSEETAGTRMGTAIHTAILEPEKFHTCVRMPECNLASKAGKVAFLDFTMELRQEGKLKPQFAAMPDDDLEKHLAKQAKDKLPTMVHPDFVILSDKDYDDVRRVIESLEHPRHAAIKKFLEYRGARIENVGVITIKSICGTPLPAPLKLKIRPDWMSVESIMDIKTVDGITAGPRSFANRCAKLKYHLSAAMYLDVARLIEPKYERDFYWLAIEKRFPYCMALYKAREQDLDYGRDMWVSAARIVSQAVATTNWAGYMPEGVKYLDLAIPRWDWDTDMPIPDDAIEAKEKEETEVDLW